MKKVHWLNSLKCVIRLQLTTEHTLGSGNGMAPNRGQVVKSRSHMNCNLSATALWPKSAATKEPPCDQNRHLFSCRSIGNQSSTTSWGPGCDWWARTVHKNRRSVGDWLATCWQLIADWLEMCCDWSATGWRLVADGLATGWRLAGDLLRDLSLVV